MALTSAPVETTVFIAYAIFALLSVQGVVFTKHIIQLNLNVGSALNSSSDLVEEDYVQVLTAEWTTVFLLCQSLPALFVILYVSTWSDRVGRKITLIVPAVGLLVASVSFTSVYLFELPVPYLLIGNLAIGLTGNTILQRSGASSYIGDTCTSEQMTIRMSILLGITFFGIGLGQLCFSFWIEETGFLQPFVFAIVLLLFSIFYITCLMKESVDVDQRDETFSLKHVVRDIVDVITSNRNNRRKLVSLWMAARVINSTTVNSLFHGIQLYVIGPPLHMKIKAAGYFSFLYYMSNTIGMLFITKALKKFCNTGDYALFYIGSTSAIVSSLVLATATDDIVYIAIPLAVLMVLPKAIIEARLSKFVEQNERGAIFALIGLSDNLGFVLGPIWIGTIYSATVQYLPSVIWYTFTGLSLVTTLLVIFIHLKFGSVDAQFDEKTKKKNEEKDENISEKHPLLEKQKTNTNFQI
ncbi:proton-coupled folate transporter-like [Antedon mediterranea]|uniref:proton-coupled folate transporter-like n=1 Tax=Antedon mediterranea TaxID=105859 RepID=UPI003AF75401